MKIGYFILAIFCLTFQNSFSQKINLKSPVTNQSICNDGGKIKVEWNYSGTDDFYVRIVFRHIPPYYSLSAADSIPVRQGYAIVGKAADFIDYRPFDLLIRDVKTGKNLDSALRVTVYNRPVIHGQSTVHQVCKGHPLKLYVIADGDFQSISWYKDGKLMKDKNNQNLWILNPSPDDNGVYKCVLNSNTPCGSVESKEMTVVVGDGPDVVRQPVTIPFLRGQDARFSASFHLSPVDENNVKFQWWRDSIYQYINYINGIEVSHLDTTIVPIRDGGNFAGTKSDLLSVKMNSVWSKVNYYCQAITSWGCTFSQAARVVDWFDVLTLKDNYTHCSGQDAAFEVMPIGIEPTAVTYQWYTNDWKVLPEGDKFVGTKTRILQVKNVQVSDNGIYYCRVTDPVTSYFTNSKQCYLYAKQNPIIAEISGDYMINNHNNKFYRATDVWARIGNELNDLCHFSWYKDGNLIYFQTQSGLSSHYRPYNDNGVYRIAKKSDTGNYVCLISNECGQVWTDTMRVVWGNDDIVACEGTDAVITIGKYQNSDNYDYIWKKDSTKIINSGRVSGANTDTLRITKCDSADSGDYFVTAVNKSDGTQYDMGKIYLEVKLVPRFIHQPAYDNPYDAFSIFAPSVIYYEDVQDGNKISPAYSISPILEPGSSGYYVISLDSVRNLIPMIDTLHGVDYQFHIWNECGEVYSKALNINNKIPQIKPSDDGGNIVESDAEVSLGSNSDNSAAGIQNMPLTDSKLEAFPNPTIDGTKIYWYGLGETDNPVVEIFNSFGLKISELKAKGLSEKGAAEFYWDGTGSGGITVSSGLYFAKVVSRGITKTIGIMVRR